MWEAAGGRVSAAVGAATAVAVLGDDPAATGAVALGIGRIHARDRRVFLFDLLGGTQGLVPYVDEDDSPGVSDMVHYGISLGRTARPQSGTPNLFIVPGGAESPLSEAVLTDRWWDVIIEQVRRSNALLLIAAPSMVPGMREMVSHLNGVLLVGEAVAPTPFIPVLAEVRAAATVRTQITPPGTARSVERSPQRRRWPLAVAVSAIALATVAALTAPRWRPLLSGGGEGDPASDVSVALPRFRPCQQRGHSATARRRRSASSCSSRTPAKTHCNTWRRPWTACRLQRFRSCPEDPRAISGIDCSPADFPIVPRLMRIWHACDSAGDSPLALGRSPAHHSRCCSTPRRRTRSRGCEFLPIAVAAFRRTSCATPCPSGAYMRGRFRPRTMDCCSSSTSTA